ncbi:hypothetical protein ACFE04_029692 [Oxalis oulophora]
MAGGRKKGASKAKANQLSLGDLVLAKVKGFPAWPAKISQPENWDKVPDPKKYFVQFFGTEEIAFVGPGDIQEFGIEAKNKLLARCKSKTLKHFAQAVREICAAFEESQQEKSSALGDDTDKSAACSETASVIKDGSKITDLNDGASTGQQNGETIHGSIKDSDSIEQMKTDKEELKPSEPCSGDITSPIKTPVGKKVEVPDGSEDKTVFSPPDKDNSPYHLKMEDPAGEDTDAKKALTNGLQKKTAVGSNKRLQGTVEQVKIQNSNETKLKVKSSSSSSTKNMSSKAVKPGRVDGGRKNAESSDDIKDTVVSSRNEISSNKKRSQIAIGKSKLGTQESSHPTKRLKREDIGDKGSSQSRSMNIDSPKSNIVNEKAAKQSEAKKMTSCVKGESHGASKSSTVNERSDAPGNEAVLPLAKRRRQAMNAMSGSIGLGSEEKMGIKPPNPKTYISSPDDVRLPVTHQPKRRRAICLSDDDDDEPKTPLHRGATTNHVEPPTSCSEPSKSIKANNENRSISSQSVKTSTGFKKESSSQIRHDILSPKTVERMSTPQVSVSPAKPDSEQLSSKEAKLTFISPKKSPHIDYVTKPVEQNKSAKSLLKVSDSGTQKKLQAGPEKGSGSVSDGMNSSHNQANNQRNRLMSSGERPKSTPKSNPRKDEPLAFAETSKSTPKSNTRKDEQPPGFAETSKSTPKSNPRKDEKPPAFAETSKSTPKSNPRKDDQPPAFAETSKSTPKSNPRKDGQPPPFTETSKSTPKSNPRKDGQPPAFAETSVDHNSFPIDIMEAAKDDSKTLDPSLKMKNLIAAAQAKRKQAHSQQYSFGNPNYAFMDMHGTTPSPSAVQPPFSATINLTQVDIHRTNLESPSKPTALNQPDTEEIEDRRVSSGHRAAGGPLSGDTEAAVARDAFEGMIETLSRTKESIGRATRLAIDCAKYNIASEVVELLIRKLETETSYHRKVDLFFLVDSITQCSHNQKGIAGASYIPIVQAALPRLLGAAAPPGTATRENRRQCLKVLRLWLERKIFPESVVRRFMDDIGGSNDDAAAGSNLRRPSRAERAVDDPIREMEGMLVDEYGSNATFQLPGLLSAHVFEDEDDDDFSLKESRINLSPTAAEPNHELELEACTPVTPNDRRHCLLEDVDGELEMEDVSKEERPSVFMTNSSYEMDSQKQQQIIEPPAHPLMANQPSTPTQPPVLAQLPAPPHLSGGQIVQMAGNPSGIVPVGVSNSGFSSSRHVEYRNNVNPQGSQLNNQFQQVNPSFPQRPLHPSTLPQTPPGHFPFANPAMHQHSYPRGPYEQWRMPSGDFNTDNQRNIWANGRPPAHSGSFIQDGYFRQPVERPPQTNMGFQHKATNNLPAAPPYPDQTCPLSIAGDQLKCEEEVLLSANFPGGKVEFLNFVKTVLPWNLSLLGVVLVPCWQNYIARAQLKLKALIVRRKFSAVKGATFQLFSTSTGFEAREPDGLPLLLFPFGHLSEK